jgi:5'(3')-deoxyribonucleotidase
MTSAGQKPVIAVDIDDVLFPFVDGVAGYHNSLKGTTLTAADFFTYNFSQVWGISPAEADEVIGSFLGNENLELRPVDGAAGALGQLGRDFDIVLVTARNEIFEKETVQWLRCHLPDLFRHVIFAGNPHDGRPYRAKGVICQELGAQLLIDDHPSNLLSAAECGVDGVLFGSKAWSVLDNPSTRITSCVNWEAVLEYVYHAWRK